MLVARDTILTSAHLLHDAQSIEVTTHDQRALTGYVIGVDARTDLAVLKIKPASPELPFLSLGDSSRVRPGKRVLALGRPPGIGQTVTTGVVIARSSSERDRAPQEALIRTDAVVDALNSGGALVDLDGKLIGIPRGPPPSAATSQVGVAIPSNTARTILKSLLEHGYVERGSIGVSLQAFDAALARALELANLRGVMISDVAARGPAATAGIRRGDVVLAVDGQAVESVPKLRSAIDNGTPGKQLRLEIARDGARSRVQVTVAGSRASGPPADRSGSNPVLTRTAGLVLASLDATTRRRLELPRSFAKGVLIEEVLAESSAEAAGIGPGDILLELDRKPVASRTEAARVWARSDGTVPALLFRSDRTFYAALEH